ncbi:MAG: hypothetical protein ACTSVM_06265, partial [Candidatus Ranarchaeia archaeon]
MQQSFNNSSGTESAVFKTRAWILCLLQDKGFWAGWLVRGIFLTLWLMIGINGPDIQDMNEIVYKGILYMLAGLDPYGQTYELTALGNIASQNYFNYPPLTLLVHLPLVLVPGLFHPIGSMDFLPGFTLIHLFFDAGTYLVLKTDNHRKLAYIFWINPLLVYSNVMTFLSLPIFFITVACAKIESPFWSTLAVVLGAATYQYVAAFLPVILIYHRKNPKAAVSALVLGILPALPFFIWNPSSAFYDLVIAQAGRGYESWWDNRYNSPTFFSGSIPSIIYNLTGAKQGGLQLAPIAFVCSFIIFIILIKDTWNHRSPGVVILNGSLFLVSLLLSSANGSFHYWLIGVALPVYIYHYRK